MRHTQRPCIRSSHPPTLHLTLRFYSGAAQFARLTRVSRVPATRRSVADALAHRLLRIGKGFLHFCLYIFLMRVFFSLRTVQYLSLDSFYISIFFFFLAWPFTFGLCNYLPLRPIIDDPVPYAGLMPFFVFTTYTPAIFFYPIQWSPIAVTTHTFPSL